MLDKLRTTMNEARSRAKRFDEYSATLAKLELKRDTCLFKLLDQVRDIAVGVRQLDLPDRRKLLGKDYNVFGGPKESVDQALRKVAPDLDAKKRVKYAAVIRLLVAKMPVGGNVKVFVRKNHGINGCVAEEKKLRMRGDRKSPKRSEGLYAAGKLSRLRAGK
jgi:hypothetical protein